MRETLIKRRFGAPALLLIAILLTVGVVAAVYFYYVVNIEFVVRQGIVPSSQNLDMGTGYVSAIEYADFSKDFDNIGSCTTWKAEDVTITQTKDLTDVFKEFRVTVQLDKAGDNWNVNTAEGDVQVLADLKQGGSTMTWELDNYDGNLYDVYLKVDGTLLKGIVIGEKSGSAHLEFKFTE